MSIDELDDRRVEELYGAAGDHGWGVDEHVQLDRICGVDESEAWTLVRILLVFVLHCGFVRVCSGMEPGCRVSFHFYDSRGQFLAGRLVEVSHIRDNGERFVPKQPNAANFKVENNQIVFSREPNPGDRFLVGIMASDGGVREERFDFGYCGQRQSVVLGSSEVNGGEGFSRVIGKLVGCREFSGWWIKMMPMFGSQEQALNPEADVDARSGEFKLVGSLPGVRHLLVVGRGREVISATSVDISRGGTSTLKELRVGRCSGTSQ